MIDQADVDANEGKFVQAHNGQMIFADVATPAPTDATYVTLSINATLSNERVLTGTASQVIITDNGAGGTVVLSLPQNIATTSAPTFDSLSLNATTNQIVLDADAAVNKGTITMASLNAARTWTFPNNTGTVMLLSNTANVQNKTLDNTNIATFLDTRLTLQDDGDNTRIGVFQLSGITAGNTRTLTWPDASGTIALTATTAPFDAQFVTLATNATLSNERVLTGTANQITLTDNGAGSTVVVSIPSSAQLSVAKLTNLTSNGFVKTSGGDGTLSIDTATYEVPLTFSTGLTRTVNTVTVNTSQNIATLSNLTTNGFVKTSGGTGALSVDTTTYLTAATGVSSITGTANQVVASASVGAITLSTPQDIATSSSPTFVGLTLSGTVTESAANEFQFRANTQAIWSSGSGVLDIKSSTTLNIGATVTTLNLGATAVTTANLATAATTTNVGPIGDIQVGSSGQKVGFFGNAGAVKSSAYTPTNVTTDRSYDANSTTLDEIADTLGTLIADLQAYNLIG